MSQEAAAKTEGGAPSKPQQALGPEQAICTLQVNKLADQLNEEVSSLALMADDADLAASYDWKVVNLL